MAGNAPTTEESGLMPPTQLLPSPLLSALITASRRWVKHSGPQKRGEVGEVFHDACSPLEKAEVLKYLDSWQRKQ